MSITVTAYVAEHGAFEVPVKSSKFEAYVSAYKVAVEKGDRVSVNNQIGTWDDFEAEVGYDEAIRAYWRWQETLPASLRSDCDPYGN